MKRVTGSMRDLPFSTNEMRAIRWNAENQHDSQLRFY